MHENHAMIGKFLQAAYHGDTALVIECLKLGIDVNAHEPGNSTALLMATRNGDIETMRVLLDHGADLNPNGSRNYTALTHAIHLSLPRLREAFGEPDSRPLELLLAAGARYNLIDAVLMNDIQLVNIFIDDGGDVNEGEGSYSGPLLMEAARHGHVEMVDLLLDRGATIEATDDLTQTALIVAAGYGQIDVVRRLLDRGAEIDSGYRSKQTALSNAAIEGHRDLVAFLLARGARWNYMDALARGDTEFFLTLLEEEILAQDQENEPEDHIPSEETVQTAKVDLVSGRFERIAIEAVGRGNLEIVRFLLDRGAAHFLDWRDNHSLIAEASKHGRVEMSRLLIARGADLHAIGRDGLTPLAWAIKEGRSEVVDLLKLAGAER